MWALLHILRKQDEGQMRQQHTTWALITHTQRWFHYFYFYFENE